MVSGLPLVITYDMSQRTQIQKTVATIFMVTPASGGKFSWSLAREQAAKLIK